MQTIPRQRLHPIDLYHMIDWVRDGWDDDELQVTPRLQRLRWHLEELPELYQPRIRRHVLTLERARIAANEPWRQSLAELRRIVWEWDKARRSRRAST